MIRYPIDIKKFEANLVEAKPIIKQLNCTVSLLNVFDLNEIWDYYWNKFRIKTTFANIVRGPEFLSIRNLPPKDKDMLLEKYKDFKDFSYIENELKLPKQAELIRMKNYNDKLSANRTWPGANRKFDWRELWNEF